VRPSLTAAPIDAKLSSASTISAASFVTSVPLMPMATPMSAFFSAGASAVWEFGIESWSQRPSIQDLIVTPVAGMMLGELRFRWKRELLERGDFAGAMLVVLLDPFQTLTEAVGRMFGRDWSEPAYRHVDPRRPLPGLERQTAPVALEFASIDRRPGMMLRWRILY